MTVPARIEEMLRMVCRTLETGDLMLLEPLLAADVQWYGTGPGGGCRTRDEVLETLRRQFEQGVRARVRRTRTIDSCGLLEVGVSPDQGTADEPERTVWFVLTLDEASRIVELQDYSSEATALHNLKVRAAGAAAAAAAGGESPFPPSPVESLVPFAHVADVEHSVEFYRLLGFQAGDTYAPGGRLAWAFLKSDRAALMVARAEAQIVHREQAVLFYLYARDLRALRDHLVAAGITPSEITDGTPGPRQEMRVTDPDGYCLMIAQIDEGG